MSSNWNSRYVREAGMGQDLLNAWGAAATGTGAALYVNRGINTIRNNPTLNKWYGGGNCSCCGKDADALSRSMLKTHPSTGKQVCKSCLSHTPFNTDTGESTHSEEYNG